MNSEQPEDLGPARPTDDDDRALARRLSREALAGTDRDMVSPIGYMDRLRHEDYAQDIELKRSVATFARWAVGAQIVAADAVVGVYIGLNHGHVPQEVISSWIGGTVIQVIGILIVITRYLFPRRSETGPPPSNEGPAGGD